MNSKKENRVTMPDEVQKKNEQAICEMCNEFGIKTEDSRCPGSVKTLLDLADRLIQTGSKPDDLRWIFKAIKEVIDCGSTNIVLRLWYR